eukprot:753228-Hanusia_phi.AAC.1
MVPTSLFLVIAGMPDRSAHSSSAQCSQAGDMEGCLQCWGCLCMRFCPAVSLQSLRSLLQHCVPNETIKSFGP